MMIHVTFFIEEWNDHVESIEQIHLSLQHVQQPARICKEISLPWISLTFSEITISRKGP